MMTPKEIQEKLHVLEQQIVSSYKHASILDDVCTLEKVQRDYQYGAFHQFANRYKIERSHILDKTHYIIMNDLGLEVARSEIKLLIDEFTTQSPSKPLKEFSIIEIVKAVYHLKSYHFDPAVIFIPTEYFGEVFDWNQKQLLSPRDSWNHLALDPLTTLKVKFSSQYAKFDDIIITSKSFNIWQYRPDERNDNERLTARFYWDNEGDPMNTILEVKTVFNFKIKDKNANIVLKLPHTDKTVIEPPKINKQIVKMNEKKKQEKRRRVARMSKFNSY